MMKADRLMTKMIDRSMVRRFAIDKCMFDAKVDNFNKTKCKMLADRYSMFLQDLRQYYHRGNCYDLYNVTFIKQILKQSMNRYPEYQISSIVYFRKVRRFKPRSTDNEFYKDVRSYLDDFYHQRNEEISDTLKDLCLQYDLAAKTIFESLGKEDMEIYKMLHSNNYYLSLLDENKQLEDPYAKLSTAISMLRDYDAFLEVDDEVRRGDDIWVIFVSNLLNLKDAIYEATGMDEEDIIHYAEHRGQAAYIDQLEDVLLEKVKQRYSTLAVIEDD